MMNPAFGPQSANMMSYYLKSESRTDHIRRVAQHQAYMAELMQSVQRGVPLNISNFEPTATNPLPPSQ